MPCAAMLLLLCCLILIAADADMLPLSMAFRHAFRFRRHAADTSYYAARAMLMPFLSYA